MSAAEISNAEMVTIQLRKWIARRRAHNVTLKPTNSHPSIPVGEAVVAEIVDRKSQGVFFTNSGFTVPGRGFIRYDDVLLATWISTGRGRPAQKRDAFDHIEFSLRDSSAVKLTDLDQAVFPLIKFFNWMIDRRKHASERAESKR